MSRYASFHILVLPFRKYDLLSLFANVAPYLLANLELMLSLTIMSQISKIYVLRGHLLPFFSWFHTTQSLILQNKTCCTLVRLNYRWFWLTRETSNPYIHQDLWKWLIINTTSKFDIPFYIFFICFYEGSDFIVKKPSTGC